MIGSTIAHYKITAKLGEGGMGEVYRARDERLNRDVAVKLLPQSVQADAVRLARFKREAQVLASLTHGNIAQVYGLEEHEGNHAIVLELVEGEDLSERIARGPVPLDDARQIALQITEALEAAHEKGIVHRDLKPANVKAAPDGTVKVLDFGLAKALAPETASGDAAQLSQSPTVTSAQTRDGVILGTAAYMSPEQARGKPVDRRADIWAFGCVLYEMLTGKTAFAAETISDTLVAILSGEADLDALPADTPAPLVHLIRRCLEKDPRKRLRDIGEARVALEDPDAWTPVPTATDGPAAVAAETPTTRTPLGLLVGVAVVVGIAAFAAAWFLKPAPEVATFEASELAIRRLTFDAGLEQEPAISPDGNYVVYSTNRNGHLDLELFPLAGGGARLLTTDAADDAQPSWSPDGTRLAFVSARGREQPMLVSSGGLGADSFYVKSEGGDIYTMPALGGPTTKLIDRGAYPSWSPDGASIAFQSNRSGRWRIWRMPSTGGEPQLLTAEAGVDRYEFHPTWSPDGRWIVFAWMRSRGGGRGLAVVPAEGGESIPIFEGEAVTPSWASDTSSVYFGSSRLGQQGLHNLWSLPFDSAAPSLEVPQRVTVSPDSEVDPSVSADNRRIVYSQITSAPQIWVLDTASGSLERISNDEGSEDYPHLNRDGKRLLFQGDRSGETMIWVRDLETGELRMLATPHEASLARWAPDGERIAYNNTSDDPAQPAGVAIQRWGETTHQLIEGPGADVSTGLQWSPDGKHLVGAEGVESGELWLLTPGGESRLLTVNGSFGTFSPDGKRIAYQRDAGRDHREIWLIPTEGGEPSMIVGGEVHLSHPQWHPSDPDRILVVIDHLDLGIVRVGSGTLERITELGSSTSLVDYPSWSPDGKKIYFSQTTLTGDLYLLER